MSEPPTLSEVVGRNTRALRGDHTLDAVATEVRTIGVRWAAGHVSAIEKGKAALTLHNLLLITYGLSRINARAISPIELLEYDGRISAGISDSETTTARLDEWWRDGTSPLLSPPITPDEFTRFSDSLKDGAFILDEMAPPGVTFNEIRTAGERVTSGDDRLARALDISPTLFRLWSERLWGHGFEDERDDRAGEDASAQKKGHVSRVLKDELRARLNEQAGDDDPR